MCVCVCVCVPVCAFFVTLSHANGTEKSALIRWCFPLNWNQNWSCVCVCVCVVSCIHLPEHKPRATIFSIKKIIWHQKIVTLLLLKRQANGGTSICEEWCQTNKQTNNKIWSQQSNLRLSSPSFIFPPKDQIYLHVKTHCWITTKNKILIVFDTLERFNGEVHWNCCTRKKKRIRTCIQESRKPCAHRFFSYLYAVSCTQVVSAILMIKESFC